MSRGVLRVWRLIHTWTSLGCTLFLLVLCVTGLPLVFRDELDGWLRPQRPYAAAPAGAHASLETIAASAQRAYPHDFVRTVYPDDSGEPQVGVVMTPTVDGSFRPFHRLFFDARTGQSRFDELKDRRGPDLLLIVQQIHANLLAGLPGEIFLGLIGLVFFGAVVSGVMLYAPFTRRMEFGTLRRGGSGRVAWLDLHNLVGVCTLVWMSVVGVTGALNGLATPLFGIWQTTDVAAVLRPYKGMPTVRPTADLQAAVEAAKAASPGGALDFVSFPSRFAGSPAHYVVWLKGDRTLTSRLLTPVMVDARTGRVALVARMPWYLRLVEVSRPLHFGDYGGPVLKILWVVLDALTIVVLVTGLQLWLTKRRWSWRAVEVGGVASAAAGEPPT